MIEASILIPSKNGGPAFATCLEGIFSQRRLASFEVIVIDSGSTDSTLEIARRYPIRIEQIPPETFHHARTRNYAASLSRGEFLVFLSQDAIPASDGWLAALLESFKDPLVGAVYGRQLPKPGSTIERRDMLDVLYGDKRIVKDLSRRRELGYRCYLLSDVNAAIRKNVWQIARFPDQMKVFEDIGIAKRILDLGWKIVYEPSAVVLHSHNHTAGGLFKRYFDMGVTWKILDIWNEDTREAMYREIGGLLHRKFTRLATGEKRGVISASVGQDLAKSIGLLLGLHEHYLPQVIKRQLSAFGLYD
jgi:rhamnosyltransferase